MCEVVMIMNKKGGVGKTTTAINLIAGLNDCDKRVLAIDLDHQQANLTKFLGVNTEGQNTLLELMESSANFDETVIYTKYCDLLPIDNEFERYLIKLTLKVNWVFAFKELIEPFREYYDFIVIDCPPNINQIVTTAMAIANKIVIPTEAEYFSVDGMTMLMVDSINEIRKYYNPKIQVAGLLLVKYQARRKLTKELEEAIAIIANKYFASKVYSAKIRSTTDIPNSQISNQSIFEYKKDSTAAVDYKAFVDEFLADCID